MKTILSILGIAAACIQSPVQAAPLKSFHPGEIWPDNNGVHINAQTSGFSLKIRTKNQSNTRSAPIFAGLNHESQTNSTAGAMLVHHIRKVLATLSGNRKTCAYRYSSYNSL